MATTKSIKMSHFMQTNNIINASKISDSQMLLHLEKGSFDPHEMWFMKDDDENEYAVMPQNVLKKIISIIRNAHEEKVYLELSRDISQNTPIDFDDVMVVALERLESRRLPDGSLPQINTKAMVKELKKEYPNLFIDLNQYYFLQGLK
ncbi:DUF2603 domain-containing protein [Helicobacter fennelliae]|uniref:UPF0763 protein HFN_0859 n=2 Tax=Helicobacter fennelliae TaxID=215 RepID=T1CS51_9HELI|nr:DUF2603 domain-containing protein [Helicobacter fennelliae]GAD19619.1 hypothetical protein HFN_0859 [Helicobacter fennelliae MRY12-0050]SQB98567.1 Protein of uncharacterised function (DUF2603) [Helicobacter fennelliae]STP07913.1 Protein of uncharacterised function (DUF2603) [Helicobacter fennelliae]